MSDGDDDPAMVAETAAAFVAARRDACGLDIYPGQPPRDLAAAYRIQDAALRIDGRTVAGWKVGRINPPDDRHLGADRLSGPAFSDMVFDGHGVQPEVPVFAEGFAASEAEFMLHVAADSDGRIPLTNAEARSLVDDVRIGLEIASSPYVGINADGPAVTISDFGNNAALVLGAPLVGGADLDLSVIAVRTEIDGQVVGEATAAAMLDGPYGAVRFLLGNLAARGIGWPRGIWVSTGAVTGVHPIRAGQTTAAHFGRYGSVWCRVVAATPKQTR